jgi:hypothetical protein
LRSSPLRGASVIIGLMASQEQKDLIASNPLAWVHFHDVLTENQKKLEFSKHRFLIDPMADLHPDQVYIKSAQVGMSVTMILKSIWAAAYLKANLIYCVDQETELLSGRGWLKYDDVHEGDEILTLNPKSLKSEWKPVTEIFTNQYSGPMVAMKTKQFDALVTPNHRWLVASDNQYRKLKGQPLYTKFVETWELKGSSLIPKTVPSAVDRPHKYSDDFVELVGWVLTEGYYIPRQGDNDTRPITSILITQSDAVNHGSVVAIRNLIDRLGIKGRDGGSHKEYTNDRGIINFAIQGAIPGRIRELFPAKELTFEFVNELTPTQLNILVSTMIKADGYSGRQTVLIQKSRQTVDAFCLAAMLCGHSVGLSQRNDGCYCVRLNKAKYICAGNITRQMVDYSGIVWCPRTDNGTFLARRNNKICWTGNTLPSQNIVSDFVAPKVDPLIASNKCIQALMGKTDSESKKNVGNRFIFFRGAFSEREAISISGDILILDELDRMPNMSVVNTYDSRLQASELGWRWRLSNPSSIGFGVDALWQDSDQRHWFVKCGKCNHEWFIDFEPGDKCHFVDKKTCAYLCGKCGKPLSDEDRRMGKWVVKYPDRNRHGYWFSQMCAPWVSAKRILEQYQESNAQFFNNFVLGKAFTPSDLIVNRATILRACAPSYVPKIGVVIGVDQNANEQIWVAMTPRGMFAHGKAKSWEEIERMKLMWNATVVCDPNPYPIMPKKMTEKHHDWYMVYFKQQTTGLEIIQRKGQIIYADRTRLLDTVATEIAEGKLLFREKPYDLEDYIADWQNIYRSTEEQPDGRTVSKWFKIENKESDWSFSTCYARIGLALTMGGGFAEYNPEDQDKELAPVITPEGTLTDMGDIVKRSLRGY